MSKGSDSPVCPCPACPGLPHLPQVPMLALGPLGSSFPQAGSAMSPAQLGLAMAWLGPVLVQVHSAAAGAVLTGPWLPCS